jgi:hypothetical protein
VVVDPVHDEVWEPGCLARGLEELEEEREAFLPKVVSEDLERHESGPIVEE